MDTCVSTDIKTNFTNLLQHQKNQFLFPLTSFSSTNIMSSIKHNFTEELKHSLFEFFKLEQDDSFIASLKQHVITKLEKLLFMPPDVLDAPCNMIQCLQHFHQFHKH